MKLDEPKSNQLDTNIGTVYGNDFGFQFPPEADHQLWVAKVTLLGVRVWRDVGERVINRCNLYSAKRGNSKKRTKSCVPKCHQWAPLKVGNHKASKQPQDILMRHLSQRKHSSLLAATRHSLMRSFHQFARCSQTKASTLPGNQQRGSAIEGHIYQMRCEHSWDLRRRAKRENQTWQKPWLPVQVSQPQQSCWSGPLIRQGSDKQGSQRIELHPAPSAVMILTFS